VKYTICADPGFSFEDRKQPMNAGNQGHATLERRSKVVCDLLPMLHLANASREVKSNAFRKSKINKKKM
jgi:hypothetical protein